ncbi:hypothetical protein Tco_1128692 [Tanacetum coccineum]
MEDMSIEEMRHEQQLVDYKIKDIMNDLGYKRFRGEKIDEEYERDCEINLSKILMNGAAKFEKRSKLTMKKEYLKKLSSTITPVLPIEEPDNSLSMGDDHLDTTPSIENLVPISSEFEGISDDTSDVPICDNNRVNVEIDLVESWINRGTLIVYSSKIDPILEEFAGELAHIAPIPPGINIEYVDASPSYIEYVSFEEVNDVEQEEKEFDLEDIFQIQDVNLREKLLKISHLITNIEALKDNPNPIPVTDSDSSNISFSNSNNSLPEFETFSDHTEETRSDSTTTHANYSLPEYDSFLFEIEPDQGRLISIDVYDNSNNTLL